MKFKICLLLFLLYPLNHSVFASSPSSVRDVLSNPQLSYFAKLDNGVSPGDSILKIITSGTVPSLTTNNLFVGDTLTIGTGTTFTIKDIGNTAQIQINSGIGQSDAYYGSHITIPRYAIHTINFTPQSNITGGYWQFLIKASSTAGENPMDSIPDQNGFDIGSTALRTSDVTCPDFGVGTQASSVGTTTIINNNSYHIITCALGSGNSNGIGTSYTVTIGSDLQASGRQLMNPAPQTGHTEGNADVYTIYIRHLDSSEIVVNADTVQGKIAVVDSVRVTATIDPTLTFTVDANGVGVGTTPCGLSATPLGGNAANTTAISVAYGSISISNFNDLAQRLSCVTNSNDGYVVTVYEDGPMHNISNGTTVPDTDCNNGCSSTNATPWTDSTGSNWGYTLHNLNVGNTVFNYQSGYKAFGNGPGNAQEIMRNTSTPVTTERAYACYRLTASTFQEAGNYENKLVYTATATF